MSDHFTEQKLKKNLVTIENFQKLPFAIESHRSSVEFFKKKKKETNLFSFITKLL